MAKSLHFLIMAALVVPAPVSAQLLDPAARSVENSPRVSLGVTIPLGGPARTVDKPQLELRATAGDRRADVLPRDGNRLYFGAHDRRAPEARIGFTLEARPQLTVAGRERPASEDRLGISTLGVVAIGVGVAAVVGGVLLLDRINAASD